MAQNAVNRYADALPRVKRAIAQSVVDKTVAFSIFLGSQTDNLISSTEAIVDSYDVLQRASSSSAGEVVSKLAARFAAGTDDIGQLVRKDQDITSEAESLDKLIIAAVSKPPAQRNAAAEDKIRSRIEEITLERTKLENIFNQRFPEYVALSRPQPLSVEQTQALLADDEVVVIFDFADKSYAWVITQTDADWVSLKITAKTLSDQVKALRSSLTFDIDKPFDAQLAFQIYLETFGAIAYKLQGKTRLSVVTNGALTSLPLQLLITKDPAGKSLKNVDWLVRSYAITSLPSVAKPENTCARSHRFRQRKSRLSHLPIRFFQRKKKVAALRSVVNFYEGGQPDLVSLAKFLPQLPDTANEVRAIGEALKADKR